MQLTVKRTFEPIGPFHGDQWERYPYEVIVWQHTTLSGNTDVRPGTPPDGYVPGLLRCYIDGQRVDIASFERAMKAAGLAWDHHDIEKAIKL